MKKVIIFILLLLPSAVSFSQQADPSKVNTKHDYYLQKSSNQKKTAWILLGGGAALVVTAAVFPQGESTGLRPDPFTLISEGHKNDDIKAAIGVAGVSAMLASIPFFIASGKNKRKAASLSFKNMMTPQIKNSSMVYIPIPAVSININL